MMIKELNEKYAKTIKKISKDVDYCIIENIIEGISGSYGLFIKNKLIGVISFGYFEEDLETDSYIINGIFIKEGYRCENYGKFLLEESFKKHREKDFNGFLYADVLDKKAHNFYNRLDFVDIGNFLYRKSFKKIRRWFI